WEVSRLSGVMSRDARSNPYVGAFTYFRGWDEVLRRTVASVVALACLPFVALLAIRVAAGGEGLWASVLLGAWAAPSLIVLVRYLSSPCPRCRRVLRVKSAAIGTTSFGECSGCGLRIFTPYPNGRSPGTSAWDYWRFRRRARAGLCGYCGYDLRSSSGRCPECGEPLPARSPQLEARAAVS
ncbi:MAG TPA: hypothetical protein VFB66_04940, partial [Tepidisphaeraceae bacterium]|nr:hypothetical protein [Tepidisphaeraceae bacterium]